MTCFEDGKLIDAKELKELVDEEFSNPTIERMVFLETRGKENFPGKVFPCYVEAYGEGTTADEAEPKYQFQCCVVQGGGNGFGMLRILLHETDLGITKRIWDKPPKKAVRDETPWLDTEILQ